MARFKAEQQGGASEGNRTIIDEEKEKQAARLARFGGDPEAPAADKQKRGTLEFTLDEYKSKNKVGNFLKKRHHGVKSHQNSHHEKGGGHGGHFKKRMMKGGNGNFGGQNQQQGAHRFKGHHQQHKKPRFH